MINLIPKEEKKKMARGFYYRLAVVYLLSLSFPVLIAGAVMTPSYFFTYIKGDLAAKKLEMQKREPVPVLEERTMMAIKDLSGKLDLIEKSQNSKFIVSQKVINSVVLRKMPNIKLTEISYENDAAKGKKISIQGTAPSRPILLLFRQSLEDSDAFKSVDLPISNFIKGSDIQFYLTLVPA